MSKIYEDSIQGFWALVFQLRKDNRLVALVKEDNVSVAYFTSYTRGV